MSQANSVNIDGETSIVRQGAGKYLQHLASGGAQIAPRYPIMVGNSQTRVGRQTQRKRERETKAKG